MATVTHVENLEKAPGSQIWSGSMCAIAVSWGVNQYTEDIFFFLTPSLIPHLSLCLRLFKVEK